MLMFLFNLCVLTIFILESVVAFTINNIIDYKNGEPAHEVAFHLIGGYIVRAYMLYCMFSGMGLIDVR